ncbi:MAG: glycosyltransferase family 4 protein [Thermoprotei archaeon]
MAYVYIAPDIRGGVERFIIETEKRLRAFGCDVKLFCNRFDPSTAFKEIVEMDKTVVPHRLDFLGRFRMYYSMKAVRAATLKAAEWKPDIIMLGAGFLWTKYILRGIAIPAVSRIHVPVPVEHGPVNRAYRWLTHLQQIEKESLIYKPILCNSEFTKRMILKLEPNAKTFVVYSGVDTEFFKPTWQDDGYLYLNGRFQHYKNQLLAIRALKGSNYRLILSGYARRDSKDDVGYYGEILRETRGAPNISIVENPSMETIRKLYQAASAVLVTSVGDPFPLVSLEAMACGKPVLGLNSGGIPEVVGRAGVLFENDPSDLRVKVDSIMGDRGLRVELGRKARSVAEDFSWDRTARELFEIFNREIVEQGASA